MKFNAIFATFIPWIVLFVGYVSDRFYDAALVMAAFAPVLIAASMLVAYREGQWSRDNG